VVGQSEAVSGLQSYMGHGDDLIAGEARKGTLDDAGELWAGHLISYVEHEHLSPGPAVTG